MILQHLLDFVKPFTTPKNYNMISLMSFTDYINEQYEDWRRKQGEGEKRTVTRFAQWLDIPQSTVSTWMKGGYPPSDETTIGKLAKKLGKGVYAALGINDPWEIETKNLIEKFSSDKKFRKAAQVLYDLFADTDEQIGKKK